MCSQQLPFYNLNDKSARIPPAIGLFARRIGISNNTISKKLKCNALCEMMCVYYCLDMFATKGIKEHDYNDLSETINHFFDRYYPLFENNLLVKTSLDFLRDSIDRLKNL